MKRSYGRIQPPPMPAHRMLSARTDFPEVVDLRQWAGPVKDQGELGSCTGHAFSSAMEWIFRRYHKASPVLSPLYLYACELLQQGDFPKDAGSDGETGSLVSIVRGCCEDSLYPDSSQQILQPTSEQDANAAQYRMGAYHGLAGHSTALSILANSVPWPVAIGFTVYESFESDATTQTGVYDPQPDEDVVGGHEVLMLGYDIGPLPTIRPQGSTPSALILNSWGAGWGDKGYFWMPMRVLDDSQTDLKIVHSGHPWK